MGRRRRELPWARTRAMNSIPATSLLDTNILLRFALNDHKDHSTRSRRFLAEVAIGRQRTYLPDTAIFEAIFTLEKSYQMPRSAIMSILDEILDMEGTRRIGSFAPERRSAPLGKHTITLVCRQLSPVLGEGDGAFGCDLVRSGYVPGSGRPAGRAVSGQTRLRSTRLRTATPSPTASAPVPSKVMFCPNITPRGNFR